MEEFEVALIALDIKKWNLESQRLNLVTYYVMDKEEKIGSFELSIIQPPEMVEEFLGKIRVACRNIMKRIEENEDTRIIISNETFLRQKLYNYFKRILMELNNPKRKKGKPKMIFTTHMDVYNENQDISFLPQIIQFFVVLNWARKYYEKEDYQRAVEPLRKLIMIKQDFGLGYKLLARSLKKIRKYEDAMYYYEKYTEVENSLDSWLDLAKSYRKGKVFDKSEKIYKDILKKYKDEKEARIGLAQIKYARNEADYLNILDELSEKNEKWLKDWLLEEFNFRIYISPKTQLTPIQAANYLGYSNIFELTQRAFRNEIPSHFNPTKARMNFFKEELDNWALVMNRLGVLSEQIVLHPDNLTRNGVSRNRAEQNNKVQEAVSAKPQKRSTKVEEIINSIRASRALRAQKTLGKNKEPEKKAASTSNKMDLKNNGDFSKKRRKRQPKINIDTIKSSVAEKNEIAVQIIEEKPVKTSLKRLGRPPKDKKEIQIEGKVKQEKVLSKTIKKGRGRPKKELEIGSKAAKNVRKMVEESSVKKKRGGHRKKITPDNSGLKNNSGSVDLPTEKEFLMEPGK